MPDDFLHSLNGALSLFESHGKPPDLLLLVGGLRHRLQLLESSPNVREVLIVFGSLSFDLLLQSGAFMSWASPNGRLLLWRRLFFLDNLRWDLEVVSDVLFFKVATLFLRTLSGRVLFKAAIEVTWLGLVDHLVGLLKWGFLSGRVNNIIDDFL